MKTAAVRPKMNRGSDQDPLCFTHAHLADFKRRSCSISSRYIVLLLCMGGSTLLLLAEIFVSVNLLLNKTWTHRVLQRGLLSQPSATSASTQYSEPFNAAEAIDRVGGVAGWVVTGSTGLSICVLLWEWILGRSIVKSDSIPRAFLNTTAFRLWSLRSYAHFCLLSEIKWGRTMRQRIVMAVYFSLQGFTSALVTVPRLIVYGGILYALKSIPDLGLSMSGFQWLQLEGYTALIGGLMRGTLAIIALSTVVHAICIFKVLSAGAICGLSVCCLRRIKKAMERDLKFRIATLMQSRYPLSGNQHETKESDAKSAWSLRGLKVAEHTHQPNNNAIIESKKATATHQVQHSEGTEFRRNSQESFHEVDLGPAFGTAKMMSKEQYFDYPASDGYSSTEVDPMVNLRDRAFPANTFAPPNAQTPASLSARISLSLSGSHSEWQYAQVQHSSSETGLIAGDAIAHNTAKSRLNPKNRLAALSFYDDLLKNISSERMMYASSLSRQVVSDSQQELFHGDHSRRESNNMSIAKCSSISLTLPSCSEHGNRDSIDRPIHPFDIIDRVHSSTTLHHIDLTDHAHISAMTEIDRDIMEISDSLKGADFDLLRRPPHQDVSSSGFFFSKGLSRTGSSHSQETIENWRIHVAPSSPTVPEIDYDMRRLVAEANSEITLDLETDSGYDHDATMAHALNFGDFSVSYEYDTESSRLGTIPIILSSHLQDAAADYEDDENLYFSAEDLHVPRPSYAYGQPRTQRQGSVNSSVGGYNYSVTSSPSLADSLSNPMYHQQAHGISMSGPGYPRSFPPRKCSLPSSVYSNSLKDEPIPRAQQFQYQATSQSHIPHHLAYAAPAIRMRTRTPSHLSNMMGPGDIDKVIRPSTAERPTPLATRKKTHLRSQSHGTRSSGGNNSGSSWDHKLGLCKEVQAGYTNTMDLAPPASSVPSLDYVSRGNDQQDRSRMAAGSGMNHKEALAINDLPTTSRKHGAPYYMPPARLYDSETEDGLVHPLDLSPLLLQQPQSGSQREYHDHDYAVPLRINYEANNGGHSSEAQAAWKETCVGLGLRFDANPYDQKMSSDLDFFSPPEGPQEGLSLRRPIPVKQHAGYRGNSSNDMHDFWAEPRSRPEMSTRMTSELTTSTAATVSTELSDATLTNSYQPTIFHVHDDDYEKYVSRFNEQPPVPRLAKDMNREQQPSQDRAKASTYDSNGLHRQPSQRNKKNLVVNVLPLKSY